MYGIIICMKFNANIKYSEMKIIYLIVLNLKIEVIGLNN